VRVSADPLVHANCGSLARLHSGEDVNDSPHVAALSEANEKPCGADCVVRRVLDDAGQNVNPAVEHVNLTLHRFRTEWRESLGHAMPLRAHV
jgi:hypothetical protein